MTLAGIKRVTIELAYQQLNKFDGVKECPDCSRFPIAVAVQKYFDDGEDEYSRFACIHKDLSECSREDLMYIGVER